MNLTKYSSLRMSQRQVQQLEVIPNRLYWTCSLLQQRKEDSIQVLNTDLDYVYQPFFKDFGPLNLGLIHRYIQTLDKMLNDDKLKGSKIYHSTTIDISKKTSAALLMGCYMVLRLGITPEEAWERFQIAGQFRPYRDPANNTCYEQRVKQDIHKIYFLQITSLLNKNKHMMLFPVMLTGNYKSNQEAKLIDCWKGIKKANQIGWYNIETFDARFYKHYGKPENGNFNVIVPGKFVAFNGPYFTRVDLRGYRRNIVEDYVDIFRQLGITTVVRLNNKDYDEKKFTAKGFRHLDYFFPDGTAPRKDQVQRFLNQIETIEGGIAVHCHAGLGRTATMIGAYVMRHYKFTAAEFIAWVRICRPGSMHGPQQLLLNEIELDLLNEKCLTGGNLYQIAPKNIYTHKNQNQIRSNSLKNISPPQTNQTNQNQFVKTQTQLTKSQVNIQEYNSVPASNQTTEQDNIQNTQSKTPQPYNKSNTINQDDSDGDKAQPVETGPKKNIMQKSMTNLSNIFNRSSLQFSQQQPVVLPSLNNNNNKQKYTSPNKNIFDSKNKRTTMYKLSSLTTPLSKENNLFDTRNKTSSAIKKPLTQANHA